MTRVQRWCTLAGIAVGLLALTVPASAATGWTLVTPPASTVGAELAGSYALSDTDAWVVGGPRKRQCGPGRAELERHGLVVGAHLCAVGQHPTMGA